MLGNEKDILLSIIVPVYNPGAYFEKCMDSILNQTYRNLEIILVNDGSTDGSEKLCHEYATADSRVKVIDQTNQGVVAAKKNGVFAATGDFIGYVDSDDYVDLDYFENMLKLQMKNQADIVAVGHFHEIGGKCELKKNDFADGVYSFDEIADKALYAGRFFEYGIGPHLYTKLFRADMLKSAQMSVPEYVIAGDDAAVVYPCLAKADRICVSGMAGYHYVQHVNSVTKISYTGEEERVDVLVDYLAKTMAEAGCEEQFASQLKSYRNYLLALRDIEVFDREENTLLIPYGGLQSGEKVIVYGAGVLGQKIHRYLTGDACVCVTAWLDRNYENYRSKGLEVDAPESLKDSRLSYDYILIANISEDTAKHIKVDLMSMGVPENKIKWFTPEFCGQGSLEKNSPVVIFGAQGIALGVYRALKQVCPHREIPCFVVSKRGMNSTSLDGVPVVEVEDYVNADITSDTEILIATPENVMPEIESLLDDYGLRNHTRLTSAKWAELMCAANKKTREFLPLEAIPIGEKCADIEMFMAKFYKDKPLTGDYKIPDWITPIQVGAALTDVRVAEITDSDGDNISSKNVNYSELTALYWVWKHRLETPDTQSDERCKYYGLVHYRRILEISDEDFRRLSENDVDVVLPYPMPYLPDIHAHHERYLTSVDWNALLTALSELQPEYAAKVPEIFGQQYLYNYNIMLAKKDVLRDYCRWLFPVLQRTEELSSPKGWERADRYIGYMGENLTTLYFMANKDKLNIAHKGCRFLV